MSDFNYLLDKISNHSFDKYPFKHISINNFFNKKHFEKIISDKQIIRDEFNNIEALIDDLTSIGYEAQFFPGCITSIEKYIEYINHPEETFDRNLIEGYGKEIIEGYGLTLRLKQYRSEFIQELMNFFTSSDFMNCLLEKFDLQDSNLLDIQTSIQKNLHGYEISPHCDTRGKALTYMINIYTSSEMEAQHLHTHIMKLKDKRKYLYDFWQYNTEVDTCWIPWNWCKTVKETNINNSIILFKPSFDTLHAVKLHYDHLKYQRNQIYGNLWFKQGPSKYSGNYKKVDLISNFYKNNE